MKDNYSTRDYDVFIRKSTHGSRSQRVQKSQYVPRERYNKLIQEANLKLKRWMIIALATGVIGFTGGYVANDVIHEGIPNAVENYQVSNEITQNAREFRNQYLINNVYRSETEPGKYYWYDYGQIYKGLLNFGDGDFDKNVYYAYCEIGPAYTSELLDCSLTDPNHDYCLIIKDEDGNDQSRSFRNYLYKNGYYEEGSDMFNDDDYKKAIDKFRETMENRFSIEHAFEKRSEEYNAEQSKSKSELDQMMSDHNMDGPTRSKGGK